MHACDDRCMSDGPSRHEGVIITPKAHDTSLRPTAPVLGPRRKFHLVVRVESVDDPVFRRRGASGAPIADVRRIRAALAVQVTPWARGLV